MSKLAAAKQYNANILPIKFSTQSDAALAVVVKQYTVAETSDWEVSMDSDGECLLKTPKGPVSAPLKVGQLVSLSSFGESPRSPYADMRIFVCLTTTSHYKKKRAILVKDIGNGVWGEVQMKLCGVVPPDVFARACRESLEKGDIVLKPGKNSVDGLESLLLNVRVGIVRCPFRLDHALALVKRTGVRDVYGEKLLGAIPFYADDGTHKPKWKLVYDVRPDGTVAEKDVASIDHVDPKSKGGADRLVNMQLMRKIDNSSKGSDEFESLADPSATLEVLKVLAAGILDAADGDEPRLEPDFAYDVMLLVRKEMKAAENTAKKFAKRYEQAMGSISKQLEKTDKEKTSLKKKANAKKKRLEAERNRQRSASSSNEPKTEPAPQAGSHNRRKKPTSAPASQQKQQAPSISRHPGNSATEQPKPASNLDDTSPGQNPAPQEKHTQGEAKDKPATVKKKQQAKQQGKQKKAQGKSTKRKGKN